MTNPAAEKKALEIVDAFMETEFDEETEAPAWLVKRIAAATEKQRKPGRLNPMYKTPHTFKELMLSDLIRGQRLVRLIDDERGIDPRFRIATPEGDLGIAMTLSKDMRERAHQMHVLKLFMAWKMAIGFIMTTELQQPDAIITVGVNRKQTLAVMSTISRKPLRFGDPEWLPPAAVSDEALQLLPSGAAAINESQIAEIERFFGLTGLFPAVKIGNE